MKVWLPKLRRYQPPHHAYRQVFLSHVHAVRAHGQRQVHVVVHDEQRPPLPAQRLQRLRYGKLQPLLPRLIAQLDEPRAPLQRRGPLQQVALRRFVEQGRLVLHQGFTGHGVQQAV